MHTYEILSVIFGSLGIIVAVGGGLYLRFFYDKKQKNKSHE